MVAWNRLRYVSLAARSEAWTVFLLSKTVFLRSKPTSGMGVCVRLFCVCAALCVQVGVLRRADPPSKGDTEYVEDQENEKAAKVQQRAVEPYIDTSLEVILGN
jgi:hypothetical protein